MNSAYERRLERASDPQRAIEILRMVNFVFPLAIDGGENESALAAARTGLLRDLELDKNNEHFKEMLGPIH